MSTSSTEKEPAAADLPLGTTAEFARMHTWLKRGLYACLIVLIVQGALIVPGLLVWYGWPTLSIKEICDEMYKVRYSDDTLVCEHPYPLFGRPEGAAGKDTARDTWGIQPKPGWEPIGFRELVRNHEARDARQAAQQLAG